MNQQISAPIYLIDGKVIASKLRDKVKTQTALLKSKHHLVPGLAVVLVGNNPASEVYVKNKIKLTKEVGMNSFEFMLPDTVTEKQLLAKIEHLNKDPKVHGILVQLPLPSHIDETRVINMIAPEKDVDGFTPVNVGKLLTGQKDALVPCTPLGCVTLIKEGLQGAPLAGKHAVIIGRSNIVGKPMASLLLQEDCTVTIVHSKTPNIQEECKRADILIAAVGKPQLVKASWVKQGAVVIDVGINRISKPDGSPKLVGDVAFDEVAPLASGITPVPGGVGPMTIACLLANTLKAACLQKQIDDSSDQLSKY